VAPRAARAGAVAAISASQCGGRNPLPRLARRAMAILLVLLLGLMPLLAAVLPEDRSDALYHAYKGGGLEVNGPSILVRKQVGKSSSLSANYYVDSITSATIDVITAASPYTEKRTEKSVGVDYVFNKSIMSTGYTNSIENDFDAQSAFFNISQNMFGDLTTVSLGYARGWDVITKTGDPDFKEKANRQSYSLGITQVLTKNLLMAFNFQTITDEGFLNNPYRSVRYLDPTSASGYSFEPEVYPRTRTSNAAALRAIYYLPYRASVRGEYRYFSDDWGIRAFNAGVGYTHPIGGRWLLDFKYRYYDQSGADFYSDLFPYAQAQNYLARDKEMSSYSNQTIGFGVSYQIFPKGLRFIDKGSINLKYDYLMFEYDDFRNITKTGYAPGEEPLYEFTASVTQLFFSIWY